ncbi:MAG: ferritin [archaeon]
MAAISKKMETAISQQINAELYSSYMYLSMSAYFEANNLKGMAMWMRKQAEEEVAHAMKFFDYVFSRGGTADVGKAIEKPPVKWASPLAVFEAGYKHEKLVTSLIDKLVDLAVKEKDHASQSFLRWYVDEQVEEEDNALSVIERIKMVKGSSQGMLLIDKELGARGAQ